MFLEVNQAAE